MGFHCKKRSSKWQQAGHKLSNSDASILARTNAILARNQERIIMLKKQPIKASHFTYTLDPARLSFHYAPLIGTQEQAILSSKNLQLSLHYIDTLEKNKPILVFLHGNSASSEIFNRQYAYFQDRFRIIGIDLLGHGQSSKVIELKECNALEKEALAAAFYNPCAMIAEVGQLLKALDIQAAHFVGWSLGGHIAYGLGMECEQWVSSVISMGSPPILFSEAGLKKGFKEWFITTLVPEWVKNPRSFTLLEAQDIAVRIGLTHDLAAFASDIQNSDPLMRRHLFLQLAQYDDAYFHNTALNGEKWVTETKLPLCLMVGEMDNGINANYYLGFAERLKHPLSHVHIMPNGTHAIFDSHEKAYYQLLDEFLARV